MVRLPGTAWLAAVAMLLSVVTASAQSFAAEQAIIQFQRAADSYAFTHRQSERRGGAPAPTAEGTLFTPQVADLFRSGIRLATRTGCAVAVSRETFVVPRVNASITGSADVPPCMLAALPKLPAELEYRMAGVALVLADAHLHVVVDVLHAAFNPAGAP